MLIPTWRQEHAIEEGFQTVTVFHEFTRCRCYETRVTTVGSETGSADCGFSSFDQPLQVNLVTCQISARPLLCNSQFAVIPLSDTVQLVRHPKQESQPSNMLLFSLSVC